MKKQYPKKCIILANGKPPGKRIFKHFHNQYSDIICADGGANSARRIGIHPLYIIGDLDSITDSTLKFYSNYSKIIKIKRQNDTDVEKCLKFAIRNHYSEIVLMGVTGNRLDHTYNNLGLLIKYFSKIDMTIVAENSFLKVYNKNILLRSLPGETISIYGLDTKTKITSDGLKFKLDDVALPFGIKDSTSNVAISNEVNLKIHNGVMLVIRDINFVLKNDLF